MAKLVWDKTGERFFENGVSKGVLFVKNKSNTAGSQYGKGVVWNGLTSVSESPSGAEESAVYADNIKYLSLTSIEEFGGTIEAFSYPDEFGLCDGSVSPVPGVVIKQQQRREFGFAYRTNVGNDETPDLGYKIHIVYNAKASVSERQYETVNESPEAMTMSWEFTTTPVEIEGYKPSSIIIIDSTKVDEAKLLLLEAKLYGSEQDEPTLPTPDEIIALIGTEG